MPEVVQQRKEYTDLLERLAILLYRCQMEPTIMQEIESAISQSHPKAKEVVDLLLERGMLSVTEREDKRKAYVTTESGHRFKTEQLSLIFQFHGDNWSRRVHSYMMREALQWHYRRYLQQEREAKGDMAR